MPEELIEDTDKEKPGARPKPAVDECFWHYHFFKWTSNRSFKAIGKSLWRSSFLGQRGGFGDRNSKSLVSVSLLVRVSPPPAEHVPIWSGKLNSDVWCLEYPVEDLDKDGRSSGC